MKRSVILLPALLSLAGIVSTPSAYAWGCKGHQTVAFLAEKHLTPEAKLMFQALLTANPIDPQLKRFCGNAITDVYPDGSDAKPSGGGVRSRGLCDASHHPTTGDSERQNVPRDEAR